MSTTAIASPAALAPAAATARPGSSGVRGSVIPARGVARRTAVATALTRSHRHRLNSDHIKDAVAPLLLAMFHHKKNMGIFNAPVDPVALKIPDYPDVVERPIDLGTVRSRMERGHYATLKALRADVELVFSNAMLYNGKVSPYHKFAKSLLEVGERGILASTERLNIHRHMDSTLTSINNQ